MKFDYERTKKEQKKLLNLALGMKSERMLLKQISFKRPKTFFNLCLRNYFIGLTLFSLGVFIDFFFLEDLTDGLIGILMFILFLNTFYLIKGIIKIIFSKKIPLHEQLEVNEKEIIETSNKREKRLAWNEITAIFKVEENLFIFGKKSKIFCLKRTDELESKIEENYPIMNKKRYKNLFLKLFMNGVVYVIPSIMIILSAFAFAFYNSYQLEKELYQVIVNEEIDETLHTYGKYQVIEKELKNLYNDYYSLRDNYEKNSATGLFLNLTAEYLQNNKKELIQLKNKLPKYIEISERQIEKIYNLLSSKEELKRIEKYNVEEVFINIYSSYALFDESAYKNYWYNEMEQNQIKMSYLDEMLAIITKKENCWEIQENKLYFCTEEDTVLYNYYYDLISKNEKINTKVTM